MYYLHNVSRAQHTRAQRFAAASHRGPMQGTLEKTVRRNRPVAVSEQWVEANKERLLPQIAAGFLEVRDNQGRIVDVNTKALTTLQLLAQEHPIEVLDSINNDSPHIGRALPLFPGGALQSVAQPPVPEAPPSADAIEEVEVPSAGNAAEEVEAEEVTFVEAEADPKKSHKKGRR